MDVSDILDQFGRLRYGMPTSQKEALAVSGALPGAPKDTSADQDVANRYAAGYLFAKAHPTISKVAQPAVDWIHGLFGDDPNLQSYADEGANNAGLQTAQDAAAALSKRQQGTQVAQAQP